MAKIIFELSEEFIKEQSTEEKFSSKLDEVEGKKAIKVMFDTISFCRLQKEIEEGKKEFVVTPDKLDDNLKKLYYNSLGEICAFAVSSVDNSKADESKTESAS